MTFEEQQELNNKNRAHLATALESLVDTLEDETLCLTMSATQLIFITAGQNFTYASKYLERMDIG